METIELVYHMKSKTKKKIGDVTLKLDINKAYNIRFVYINALIISHLHFKDNCFLFLKTAKIVT